MGKLLRGTFTVLVLLLLIIIGAALGVALTQGGILGLLGVANEPTVTSVTVLERIQALAELTTQRYNFSSIVTSQREMPPLLEAIYGDRQVLIAVGYIDAGIDLTSLEADAITITSDTVNVTLPAPTLQACVLDENATYVAERETGIFAPDAPNLDSDARQFAVAQFRDQALETGILQDAEDEARVVITQVLLASNPAIQRVNIAFSPADADVELPTTCR
jgi:hypothetical protein